MEQIVTPEFWFAVGQIIIIDILLGGDNAVVIALACRNLPTHLRRQGIIWGAVGAIGLRIILTFFAVSLLALPYLKLVGALLLLWIGIKLIAPPNQEGEHNIAASDRLWGAVQTIIVADLVMSIDNVIGVAGAAKDNVWLLVFGLTFSIPLIIWGSKLVLHLIDRFPIIVTCGGGLLGWVAGSLAIHDPLFTRIAIIPTITKPLEYGVAAVSAFFVVFVGTWIAKRHRLARKTAHPPELIDLAQPSAVDIPSAKGK